MLRKLGAGSVGLSVTVIGLLGVKDFLPASWSLFLADDMFTFAAVCAVGLLIVGIVLLATSFIVGRIDVASTRSFYHSVAKQGDLEAIRSLAQQLYQTQDLSPLSQMQAWLRKHPRAFFVVFTKSRNRLRVTEDLKGYFCLLPISDDAARKIRSGQLTVQTLSHVDLLPSGFSAIYLGGIAALGNIAKGACLSRLQLELETVASQRPDAELLTRPVTKDGLRIARSYGFRPIGAPVLTLGGLAAIQLSEVVAIRRDGHA